MKKGEKHSFDFLPDGYVVNFAFCADIEIEEECWFPSISGKNGSLEFEVSSGFMPKQIIK